MDRQEDLLNLGALLTSAFRSLSPSILGKRRASFQTPKALKPPELNMNWLNLSDLNKFQNYGEMY